MKVRVGEWLSRLACSSAASVGHFLCVCVCVCVCGRARVCLCVVRARVRE